MIRMVRLFVLMFCVSPLIPLSLAMSAFAEPASRIVSVGGSVTEIIYALGEEGRLVARDTTSTHPPEALALPDVGYIRRLSPEGVLAVSPDLIVAEEGAGPPEAVELLAEAAVPMVEIPDGYDRAAVLAKINAVAEALGVPEKGAALAETVGAELDAALDAVGEGSGQKVLFILSAQGGRIMAAGQDNAADAIIGLAGGVNAMQGFEGYKPVNDEALANSGAEVILMMDRGGSHAISDEEILRLPALAVTPAAQTGHVVRLSGLLLLGFSVRTPEAVAILAGALNGDG